VALALAVLYFAFIELLMIDASRELSEARHFRGHIVALTVAENGAELAAENILSSDEADVKDDDWQGTLSARMRKDREGKFRIDCTAHSKGPDGASASLLLEGETKPPEDVRILFSRHSQ
jgi:hypothetical protein